MVGYQSPASSGPEARGGDDRSPSSPAPLAVDLRLPERLDSVERAVRQMAAILTERLPGRLREDAATHRGQLRDLARELGTAFRALRGEVASLQEALPQEVAAVEGRVGGSIGEALHRLEEELGRRVDGIDERLRRRLDGIDGSLAEVAAVRTDVEAVRADLATLGTDVQTFRADVDGLGAALESVGSDARGLRAEMEALRLIPDHLTEAMAAVREAMGEIATAHASVDGRLEEVAASASGEVVRARVDETTEAVAARMGEAMGEFRGDIQGALATVDERLMELAGTVDRVRSESEQRASALQTALERVDNLAEAVETIGRRRGFKHVVASDERLRQEQAAMTDRLSEAGEGLTSRLDEIKAELEDLRRAARDSQAGLLAEEIRRRVVDELVTEEMVKTMVQQAGEAFERRLQELTARLDARLDEAIPPEPARKGLFRRTREQA